MPRRKLALASRPRTVRLCYSLISPFRAPTRLPASEQRVGGTISSRATQPP